jgi:hypothetical protein
MAERLLFPDSITGLPKQSNDTTVIRLGQIEVVDINPFVIDPLANTVANLSAEKLNGRDFSEVKQETLEDKKIVEYRQEYISVLSGQNETEITENFITNHVESLYSYVSTPLIEGVVLYAPSSYYRAMLVDSNNDWIDDGSGNQVFGVYVRTVDSSDNSVLLTWATGSTDVSWAGSFITSPADYIDKYICSPNNTWYKVSGYTDLGGGIGTFSLYDSFDEAAGANTLSALHWIIQYYSVEVGLGHDYTFASGQTILGYYPYRTNLYDANELLNNQLADFVTSGYVTQAQFNAVKTDPVLLSSDYGTIDGFTDGVDVANLSSGLSIQSSTGVTISIGSALDTVNIYNATIQSLDAIQLSINSVIITTTAAELNQLSGIGSSVNAINLTQLTDGSYTDLHTHVVKINHTSGVIGSVVYVDASNNTIVGVADPALDADGFKVTGVISGFDGISGQALVILKGPAPLYTGHGFSDGDIVYLSTINPGELQTVVPTAVNHHVVKIGEIHNSQLFVDINHLWQVS